MTARVTAVHRERYELMCESGELPAGRWQSYILLKREAKFSDDRTGALREKYAKTKAIALWNKQRKKDSGKK
jgi:ribosome biogenesis GTPase